MATQIEVERNKIFDDANRNNVNRDDVNRGITVPQIPGISCLPEYG